MLVFLFATALFGLTAAVDDTTVRAEQQVKPTDHLKVTTTSAAGNGTIPLIVPKEGDVCNILRLPRFTENPGEYLECVKPQGDKEWTWEGIGLWEKKSCPKGKSFSPLSRSCKNANAVRRQHVRNCEKFGGCHQVYQPCQDGACQQPQQVTSAIQQPPQWNNVAQQVQPCQQGIGGCEPQQITIQAQPIAQPLQPCQGNVGGCQQQHIIQQPQPMVQPVQHLVHPVQPVVLPQPTYVHQHVVQQQILQPQPVVTHVQPPVVHPVVEPVRPVIQPIQPHIISDCAGGASGNIGCNPTAYHQPVVAPRPCPSAHIQVTHADVQAGSPCSWMSAPLVQANAQQNYYKCQPTQGNIYCGKWKQQSCGQSQIFNPQVQICAPQHLDIHAVQLPQPVAVQPAVQQTYHVHQPAPVQQVALPAPTSCAQQHIPIGQCNAQGKCPGYAQCQQGTCCQNAQRMLG